MEKIEGALNRVLIDDLPEWATWNKKNILIIKDEYHWGPWADDLFILSQPEPNGDKRLAGILDFSAWLWSDPDRIQHLQNKWGKELKD